MSQQRKQTHQSQLSPDALKETAKRQLLEVIETSEDAVTSGAWVYPIRVSLVPSFHTCRYSKPDGK
jgi:hypothetical protein